VTPGAEAGFCRGLARRPPDEARMATWMKQASQPPEGTNVSGEGEVRAWVQSAYNEVDGGSTGNANRCFTDCVNSLNLGRAKVC
jgi:hypothetical protein